MPGTSARRLAVVGSVWEPRRKFSLKCLLADRPNFACPLFTMLFTHYRFPGAQPISFAQKHIEELKNENYFVSEKADGIRCLMYTTINQERGGEAETFLVGMGDTLLDNQYIKIQPRLIAKTLSFTWGWDFHCLGSCIEIIGKRCWMAN